MKSHCNFHDPQKWGAHVWYMLDMMVIRLDPDDAELVNHIMMQFVSLMHTIPCDACRIHYQQYINDHPLPLDSQLSLAKWVHACRCSVNTKIGRPNITFTEYLQNLQRAFDCDLLDAPVSKTLHDSLRGDIHI